MGDGDECGGFFSARPAEGYYACAKCFEDDEIRSFINSHLESTHCDFCGGEDEEEAEGEPIAAPLDEIAEFMEQSVSREYRPAVTILPWDGSEGGYQGVTYDSRDLLEGLVSLPNDDGRLIDVLADCFRGGEPWCERNPFSLSEDEHLIYSWESFCRLIKHERRFFFLQANSAQTQADPEDMQPSELLEFIGQKVEQFDLIATWRPGALVHRARQQKIGESLILEYDVGPPPVESATRSNRMSPAGIVMFYGSDEPETSVAEIDDDPALGITIGTFRLTRDARVLDLTHLPERIPFFRPDADSHDYDRYALNFLHDFVERIAVKVEPGDREHVDYVPTQVVTEWFRVAFKHAGRGIDGICYPSVQRQGGRSVVLFADRNHLVLSQERIKEIAGDDELHRAFLVRDQREAWLELIDVKVARLPEAPKASPANIVGIAATG